MKKSTGKKQKPGQDRKITPPQTSQPKRFLDRLIGKGENFLKKVIQPLDYLFIFRPTLFFPVWIMSLAGYNAFFRFNGNPVWWSWHFDGLIFLNFVAITLAAGATFIINQLQDIETDKINKKLFLISENYVKPEIARRIAFWTIGLTLLFFLLYDWQLFITMSGVVLIWGYFYNYKPFIWKDKPVLGMVNNFTSGLCLFLSGWGLAGYGQWKAFGYATPYLFAWLAVSMLTTIPDQKGDCEVKKTTFAVKFGVTGTVWAATISLALSFGLGMYLDDPVISLAALLSSPLYIIMVFKPNRAWVLRAIRYPMLFIALALCVEFPIFFIVILINFYLSRIYYNLRFNLNYPTFQVEDEKDD